MLIEILLENEPRNHKGILVVSPPIPMKNDLHWLDVFNLKFIELTSCCLSLFRMDDTEHILLIIAGSKRGLLMETS